MSTYPPVVAGMAVTSALLQSMLPQVAYKSGDQSVTNSTTLVNDTALVVPVAANAVYRVDVLLYYTGDAAADLKWNFTAPAGATSPGVRYISLNGSLAIQYGSQSLGAPGASGANGASMEAADLSFTLVTGATTGNLQLQFAQNAATLTAITVKAGSVLTARRIV